MRLFLTEMVNLDKKVREVEKENVVEVEDVKVMKDLEKNDLMVQSLLAKKMSLLEVLVFFFLIYFFSYLV